MQTRTVSATLRVVALRCLIVDDSEEFLVSSRALLIAQGVDVVACASSSVEALRLVESLRPDVTLVDIHLGEEDGLELARRLAAGGGARVVLISTHAEEDLAELIADSPAGGFIPKTALSAAAIELLLR